MVVQAVLSPATAVQLVSSTYIPPLGTHGTPSTSVSDVHNTPMATNASIPRTNAITHSHDISLALFISLPLGLLGISLMATACVCAKYCGRTTRDRKSDVLGKAGLLPRVESLMVGNDVVSMQKREVAHHRKKGRVVDIEKASEPAIAATGGTGLHCMPTRASFAVRSSFQSGPGVCSGQSFDGIPVRREFPATFLNRGMRKLSWRAPKTPRPSFVSNKKSAAQASTAPCSYTLASPSLYRPQSATPNSNISRCISTSKHGQFRCSTSDELLLTERTSDKDTLPGSDSGHDSDPESLDARVMGLDKTGPSIPMAVTDTVLSHYLAPSPLLSRSSVYSRDTGTSVSGVDGSCTDNSTKTVKRTGSGAQCKAPEHTRSESEKSMTGFIGRTNQRPKSERSNTESSAIAEEDQIVISRDMFN